LPESARRRESQIKVSFRIRRWRAIRRRARSETPPQTPCSMRWNKANSRHASLTGHSAQTRLAISTPTPSRGKNVSGDSSRQLPCAIQVSSCTSAPFGSAPLRGSTVRFTSKLHLHCEGSIPRRSRREATHFSHLVTNNEPLYRPEDAPRSGISVTFQVGSPYGSRGPSTKALPPFTNARPRRRPRARPDECEEGHRQEKPVPFSLPARARRYVVS
jgi:hypothetical protein